MGTRWRHIAKKGSYYCQKCNRNVLNIVLNDMPFVIIIIIVIIMKDFTLINIIISYSLSKYHESTKMFCLCKGIDGNTTASDFFKC